MPAKAVFLDRDGTIIDDVGYLDSPERIKLLPGAELALKTFSSAGFLNVIVTNQSGIARGILDEETLGAIHRELLDRLEQRGAKVDAIYHCPFHPDGKRQEYRQESDLRKPAPGMLRKAAGELDIDLHASWMIGDAERDVEAGRRAGCRTILLRSAGQTADPIPASADYTARSLPEAARIILHSGTVGTAASRAASETTERAAAAKEATPPAGKSSPDPAPNGKTAPAEPLPRATGAGTGGAPAGETQGGDEPTAPAGLRKEQADVGLTAMLPDRGEAGPAAMAPRAQPPAASGKAATDADAIEPVTTAEEMLDVQREILLAIREQQAARGRGQAFSVTKMIAGILQMLAILALVSAIWMSPQPGAVVWGLVAATLQAMSLTFFVMHQNH